MKTRGNTILITGGGSGIGAALATRFHDAGNAVIVTGRRLEALERTCAGRPGMTAMVLDIDKPEAIASFAAEVVDAHPALNVVIHNAGIMRLEMLDQPRDLSDAEATITTNLLGPDPPDECADRASERATGGDDRYRHVGAGIRPVDRRADLFGDQGRYSCLYRVAARGVAGQGRGHRTGPARGPDRPDAGASRPPRVHAARRFYR